MTEPMKEIRGTVLAFGDGINTDDIIPSNYLQHTDVSFLATKAMEKIRPTFYDEVQALGGCIIVGGTEFGTGSSREQAPDCLKAAGVRAIIAESFRPTFFENSCNVGLPVLVVPGCSGWAKEGDELVVDFERAEARREADGSSRPGEPLPEHYLELVRQGGLLAALRDYIVAHGMDQPYPEQGSA